MGFGGRLSGFVAFQDRYCAGKYISESSIRFEEAGILITFRIDDQIPDRNGLKLGVPAKNIGIQRTGCI
jgi:hypothetical protein